MARLKHAITGVVVHVADATVAHLGSEWGDPDAVGIAEIPAGEPTATWKVDQLKAYAAEHGIDLGEAKKKDEILSALGVTVSPA